MPTPVPSFRGSFRNARRADDTTSHFDPPVTGSFIEPDESTRKYMSTGTRVPSRTCALQTALPPCPSFDEPPSVSSRPGDPPPPPAEPPWVVLLGGGVGLVGAVDAASLAWEQDQPPMLALRPARTIRFRIGRQMIEG